MDLDPEGEGEAIQAGVEGILREAKEKAGLVVTKRAHFGVANWAISALLVWAAGSLARGGRHRLPS